MNISFDDICNIIKPCPWKAVEYLFSVSKGEHPGCDPKPAIQSMLDFDSKVSLMVQMLMESKDFFPEKMEKILKFILTIPKNSLGKGAIYLIHDETDVLQRIAECDIEEPAFTKCREIEIGECLCGHIAKTKKILTGKCHDMNCMIEREEIFPHAHYCSPIVNSENELLGVLNIYLDQEHERDEKEEEYLSKIVHIVGWFIEDKRQEREANKIRHRMFSALSKMTLRREVTTQIVEDNNRLLEKVNSAIGRAVQSVDDKELKKELLSSMKDLTHVGVSNNNLACFMEEGDITIRENEVVPVVESALHILSDQIDGLNVNIVKRFEPETIAFFRATMIEQVIDAILQNAIDQFKKQPDLDHNIDIEVTTEDYAIIGITDNGGGIDSDIIGRIFDPTFTTKTVEEGKLGLSLYMAKQVVEEHRGLIICKSKNRKTTFIIKLPLK